MSGNFGHNRERQLKKLLEADGWFVLRAPASLGVADLVALKKGETPRLIESKANTGSPYMNFRAADRRELLEVAERAGAVAQLAFWPKRGTLEWIGSEAWPK
jgi:Holliday junction resolvase